MPPLLSLELSIEGDASVPTRSDIGCCSDEGDASVPSPPNTTPAPTRSDIGCCSDRGDASVPAPTRSDIGCFLLDGHQHMMPPRSITIPPSQTRGTSGLTKTRMVASEAPFQSARNT